MTLKIEVGKYYRTRDGLKFGPMKKTEWPECVGAVGKTGLWNWDGTPSYKGKLDSPDLIAEWTDETESAPPAPTAPDYNDGNWHGWNGEECPDSIHPASLVEFVWHSFNANKAGLSRNDARAIMWAQVIRFRVVEPYTAPREWWIVGDCEAYASEAEAIDAAATLFGDAKPVHVREVTE